MGIRWHKLIGGMPRRVTKYTSGKGGEWKGGGMICRPMQPAGVAGPRKFQDSLVTLIPAVGWLTVYNWRNDSFISRFLLNLQHWELTAGEASTPSAPLWIRPYRNNHERGESNERLAKYSSAPKPTKQFAEERWKPTLTASHNIISQKIQTRKFSKADKPAR